MSDEEWACCAPYLALMKEDAAQRDYASRAVCNAVRYLVRTGCPWRDLPNDLPPWYVVHPQVQRWIKAGCFEALAHDLRKMLRLLAQKAVDPTAVILDGRTLQSTRESGERAGYDGYKPKKGSKVHIAVDTLGHLLALSVTPANEQERAQVGALIGEVQEITDEKVEVAYADQGYTGEATAAEAAMESSWWSSGSRRPSAALCSCPDAGWWSAPLPGRAASVVSLATMSAYPPASRVFIGSPS